MDDFDRFLDYQQRIAELTLDEIKKIRNEPARIPRTYKLRVVETILKKAGKPLHISDIIKIAERDHDVTLERDSVASYLAKKIGQGKQFVRTAPNTFALSDGEES
jgi:hypothetical protein